MMKSNSSLNRYINDITKKYELYSLLLNELGQDILKNTSMDSLTPEKVVVLIETYRLMLYQRALKKAIKKEKRKKELASPSNVIVEWEEIDEHIKNLYEKVHLIMPIKDALKKYGIEI